MAAARRSELGSPKRAADVVEALLWEAGLERGFPEAVEPEAALATDAARADDPPGGGAT